jgi:hypothetical protein
LILALVLLLDSAVRLGIALVTFNVLGLTFSVTLGFTLPFAVVITIARVLAVADVFGVTVALIRAARTIAVAAVTTTAIIVTVSARRQLASRTTGRGARTAATR